MAKLGCVGAAARCVVWLALGAGALGLQACGGAARAPAEAPTQDLSELERRLDQHQAELEARFGALSPPPAEPAASAAPESPESPEPPSAPSPMPESAGAVQQADADEADEESACEVGCQALEGMRRAASRICEISGVTSAQCVRARDRVGRAEDRVSQSGCGC